MRGNWKVSEKESLVSFHPDDRVANNIASWKFDPKLSGEELTKSISEAKKNIIKGITLTEKHSVKFDSNTSWLVSIRASLGYDSGVVILVERWLNDGESSKSTGELSRYLPEFDFELADSAIKEMKAEISDRYLRFRSEETAVDLRTECLVSVIVSKDNFYKLKEVSSNRGLNSKYLDFNYQQIVGTFSKDNCVLFTVTNNSDTFYIMNNGWIIGPTFFAKIVNFDEVRNAKQLEIGEKKYNVPN